MQLKTMNFKTISKLLKKHASTQKSLILKRFHKTIPGHYGEKIMFFGIPVPILRQIIKNNNLLMVSNKILVNLLKSTVHEVKLLGYLILLQKYQSSKTIEKKEFLALYLNTTKYIDSWDVVDLTAAKILGDHAFTHGAKQLLSKLATSNNMWERRIAIVSTHYYIKKGIFDLTFDISSILLNDNEDIIHKAIGWMLREVGKKNKESEVEYLKTNLKKLPRITLRYAIERFTPIEKAYYLSHFS